MVFFAEHYENDMALEPSLVSMWSRISERIEQCSPESLIRAPRERIYSTGSRTEIPDLGDQCD